MRQAYGVLMEASERAAPEVTQANRAYSVVRRAIDAANIDVNTGRRIGDVGKASKANVGMAERIRQSQPKTEAPKPVTNRQEALDLFKGGTSIKAYHGNPLMKALGEMGPEVAYEIGKVFPSGEMPTNSIKDAFESGDYGPIFTSEPGMSENVGPVTEHTLKFKNPHIITTEMDPIEVIDSLDASVTDEIQGRGHDGIIVNGANGKKAYIAFKPEVLGREKPSSETLGKVGSAISGEAPSLTSTIDARLHQFADMVESGATESVGKALGREPRGSANYGTEEVRRGGGGMFEMFPELEDLGRSPSMIAKAIRQGKGPLFTQIREAVKAAMQDELESLRGTGEGPGALRSRALELMRKAQSP
jgi:hypothetical protein